MDLEIISAEFLTRKNYYFIIPLLLLSNFLREVGVNPGEWRNFYQHGFFFSIFASTNFTIP